MSHHFWVAANDYEHIDKDEVIQLWKLMNDRICVIIKKMPEDVYQKTCDTGKQNASLHTLDWLARDYVEHLKHHLNQIFTGSFPNHKYPA